MSTIPVPDIAARARARIAARYQLDALARRSARPDVDRFQPERRPWAHGFWPGLDRRLGKWGALDAPLAELIEVIPPEHCHEAYARLAANHAAQAALGYNAQRPLPTLAEFCEPKPPPPEKFTVHPPIRPPKKTPEPKPPTLDDPSKGPAYTILDSGGVFTSIHRVASPVTSATGSSNGRTQKLARSIYATGLQWSLSIASGGDANFIGAIPELNWQLSDQVADGGGGRTIPTNTLPLAVLLLDGATIQSEITEQAGSLGDPQMTVHLSYRNVRTREPRPIADLPDEDLGPTRPMITELSEQTLAVLDLLSLPPEWWALPTHSSAP